jgi:two-component system, NarL family, sensor kinase
MTRKSERQEQAYNETISLKNRLEETEETLRAIRQYMVDAFVVTQEDGQQVVTLGDASFPYRMMVESMNEGAVTLVPDGTIFYCNPRFAQMVHMDSEKLIGVQLHNFIQPDQREHFEELFQQASHAAIRGEFVFKTSEGKRLPVQLSMYRLGEEATSGISILATDISERIQNEEKIRALASELTIAEHEERHRISQILHDDLQQRLFAVKAQLAFLHVDETAADARSTVDHLQNWLSEAITLTRNLSVDLSPSVLRGEGLAQAVLWLCARMKEQHGLHLQVSATDHLNHLDDHFRVMIFQTVRELLFNIVKHAGTLEASIVIEQVERAGRITISDSGKGFDTNVLTQYPLGAHGILLLRDRLILMGGTMTIHSKPGEGTQVVLEFPMNQDVT